MKKAKLIIWVFLFSLISIFCSYHYGRLNAIESVMAYGGLDNLEDYFAREKYGQSPYYEVIDNIKVSVERVIKEKYFITYSWITGNQSYFGITLLIEHLEKMSLKKEYFQEIWLEDDLNNKYKPLPYYKLIDFPEDQPLGWKQVFFGKFEPLNKNAKLISLYFRYNNNLYKIKNINIE
jgi:hypothetical protein